LEDRRPHLVSIVAPAGTGKTRLLEEFLARLDPNADWQVATGRCLPYGEVLTYWPLRGLLEDLIGAIDRDRVVAGFVSGGYGGEDASRLADLIMAPLGIESEAVDRVGIFNESKSLHVIVPAWWCSRICTGRVTVCWTWWRMSCILVRAPRCSSSPVADLSCSIAVQCGAEVDERISRCWR
jgi:hypothetical protein